MFELINRIRKINLRELTPLQIALGIAGVIVAIWLIGQIINIALSLVPVALVALALYIGYRLLTNQDGGQAISRRIGMRRSTRRTARTTTTAESAADTASADVHEETSAQEDRSEESEERLSVEQPLNPETGFREADISRLEAREKERPVVDETVREQIEERRRRLLGDSDSSDD